MAHRKFLLAGVLLLAASACGLPEDITDTATVPPIVTLVPTLTTAIPTTTQGAPAMTDTMLAPTVLIMTDTPLPPATQATLPPDTAALTSVPILGEHQIKSGETLSCIGRGYGVLPKAIADVNGIQLTTTLYVGQVLKIPAVQWTNIPAGPVCSPQFPSPFPGLPVPGPSLQVPDTPTPTLQVPDTPTPSETLRPPKTPTPTAGGATYIPPGTP